MKKIAIPLVLFITGVLSGQTKTKTMESIATKVDSDRAFFTTLGNIYPADSAVNVSAEQISGVNCYWFTPREAKANQVILYLHGGSFALGSVQSHKAMVSNITSALGSRILFVEYSLAPEKPFPNGVNDVVKVYKEILKRNPGTKILFMGDSAGGGLAISAINFLGKENLKSPDALITISAWINLRCNTTSYETRKKADPILTQEMLQEYAGYYASKNIHEADPSQMKFKSFPPTFLLVGSNEILFDDTENFYSAIKVLQPKIKMKEYEDQNHVWLLSNIHSNESKAALQDIREFIETSIP